MNLPLLVRPNSVMAIGSRTGRPDYDQSDKVRLQVCPWEGGNQARIEIPTLDGRIETRFDVRREGNVIDVQRTGRSQTWSVSLIGIDSEQNMEDAELQIIIGSTLIHADTKTNGIRIALS